MSEAEDRANEALERFRARNPSDENAAELGREAEATAAEDRERLAAESTMEAEGNQQFADEVAAAMGVQGEKVDLPPQLVRGVLIYELEDGSFGSQPVGGMETLDDALSLAERFVRRAQAQFIAGEVRKEITRVTAQRQQVRRAIGGVAGALSRIGARRNQ